jgi:hypothetical protein
MSLDDIKLSPYLVKKLYENSLLDYGMSPTLLGNTEMAKDKKEFIVNKTNATKIKNFDPIKFLGKNAKNILIIVDEKEHAFLGDDELSFLINILDACTVSMHDVALVNASNNVDTVYENLNYQFTPTILIFLGTEPHLLNFPIQIPQYKIQDYNNQQYLSASSLQKLASNKEEKKKLWTALKVLFAI